MQISLSPQTSEATSSQAMAVLSLLWVLPEMFYAYRSVQMQLSLIF